MFYLVNIIQISTEQLPLRAMIGLHKKSRPKGRLQKLPATNTYL